MPERFTIERGRWYAWTMYPGYVDMPYHSPIYVEEVEPLSGRRLRLKFFNAAYAEGVQGFELTLTTLARRGEFLVSDLGYNERVAVVGRLSVAWMQQYFPTLTASHLSVDASLQYDLTAALLPGLDVQAAGSADVRQRLELFLWEAMIAAIREGEAQAVERLETVLTFAGHKVTSDGTEMLLVRISTGAVVAHVSTSDLEV